MPRGKHGNQVSGAAHPRWNSGKMISADGYVKIRVGVKHPLADPNGYAYEHLIVWCAAGRPRPQMGYLLHHRDEDRQNNRLENLELKKRGDHNAHHLRERYRDERGRLLPLDGRTHDDYPRKDEADAV